MSARALDVLIPADIRFPLERANGVQIVKTAHALARQGARATLLVRRSDPRPDDEILALYGLGPTPRLAVERVDVGHRRGSFQLPRLRYLAAALVRAQRAAWRGAHVFTRDLQLAELLALAPARARLTYEAHAVEALMYQERGTLYGTGERPRRGKTARLRRRERRVWRRAAGFVTTTAGIRDSLRDSHGGRTRGPTRVIPNGCDVESDRSFPGLSEERPPRVLYAGQLYPWKGVDVLVEAMVRVPAARLVVLGGLEGEPDLERIRSLVRSRRLDDRAELLGTVPQARVPDQLRRAAVVVVPVRRSVMTERHMSPIKALEAMAAGRPIVASDLPSCRELLADGVTALLVPPGDAGALSAVLNGLLADRALQERLARAAWEKAPAYSWDARAQALLALLREAA